MGDELNATSFRNALGESPQDVRARSDEADRANRAALERDAMTAMHQAAAAYPRTSMEQVSQFAELSVRTVGPYLTLCELRDALLRHAQCAGQRQDWVNSVRLQACANVIINCLVDIARAESLNTTK